MDAFLTDLTAIAPAVGQGSYAFVDAQQEVRGWVQLIFHPPGAIKIHRLWTLKPGKGNGSTMLRAVCELADRHGIEILLKPLPFGRKPYPMTREQLLAWYAKHGFEGNHRKMVRKPLAATSMDETSRHDRPMLTCSFHSAPPRGPALQPRLLRPSTWLANMKGAFDMKFWSR